MSFARISLVVVALLVFVGELAAEPINVYWTNRNGATVNRTEVSTGTTTVLVPGGFSRLQDVDLSGGTLYFSDWGLGGANPADGTINRVNTDGTGLSTIYTGGDAIHQLAISGNTIHFTRGVTYAGYEVSRVNTDGSNYTQIIGAPSASNGRHFPSGLALGNGLIYWGDIGVLASSVPGGGAVNSMNPDGTGIALLENHVDGRGRGFAFDDASQTIFLTAHNQLQPQLGGQVFAYDIIGDTLTQLYADPSSTGFWDIEIDPTTNRIWWTDFSNGQILSANFDGSDVQVELSGLINPYGLALEFAPVPEPASMALWGLLSAGCGAIAWRRRKRQAA